jgi:3-phenylpropionate/trans-cinnamate dioxygenase ferredoxin subunit
MIKWVEIGAPNEIYNQECKIVEINNTPIAVFNLDGDFYAIEDNCPHQHLPLADGLVENGCITCPYHGAKFDLRSGDFLCAPACDNLTTFPTRVIDGKIFVGLETN